MCAAPSVEPWALALVLCSWGRAHGHPSRAMATPPGQRCHRVVEGQARGVSEWETARSPCPSLSGSSFWCFQGSGAAQCGGASASHPRQASATWGRPGNPPGDTAQTSELQRGMMPPHDGGRADMTQGPTDTQPHTLGSRTVGSCVQWGLPCSR